MKKTGTVRWFNSVAGFGYIKPDNHNEDVFAYLKDVHSPNLQSLHEGQHVTFELTRRNGREYAVNIQQHSPELPNAVRTRFWHLDNFG